jgi:hypothetical protein
MNNPFYPMPVVNLIVDYKDSKGQCLNQTFQVPFSKPLPAAQGVFDMLKSKGYIPYSIIEVVGDYSLDDLQRFASEGSIPRQQCRFLYFDKAAINDLMTNTLIR